MKKILMIVSDKNSKKKNDFVKLIQSNFKDKSSSIELVDIKKVWVSASSELTVEVDGKNLQDYDLVVFRGIRSYDQSLASSIAMCLEYLNIKFVDKVYGEMGISEKKLASLLKLYVSGIPMPKTVFYSGDLGEETYHKIEKSIGLPFVAKDLYLQLGQGVFLIKDLKDFKALSPKREYMFQEFLDKKNEYRILVLGESVGVFEEKISDDDTEFRNNVALGAREVFFDKSETPDDLKQLAISSAKALNLQIAGVDVVVDTKGNNYVFEVNRGPGLTYDDKISPEFKEIAEFFENYE